MSVAEQTLVIARKLKQNGVDLRNIQLGKTINKKKKYILLKEVNQEGIDINKIIKEENLDGELELGKMISAIRLGYNGKGNYVINDEEKREAEELGLIIKIKGQDIGQVSFKEGFKNIELSDEVDQDLKELIEKTKEGGIVHNE